MISHVSNDLIIDQLFLNLHILFETFAHSSTKHFWAINWLPNNLIDKLPRGYMILLHFIYTQVPRQVVPSKHFYHVMRLLKVPETEILKLSFLAQFDHKVTPWLKKKPRRYVFYDFFSTDIDGAHPGTLRQVNP